ncbi:MAG: sensor histidine kinase [Flavobacteriales bacterium]|nr:sensor histidine kinase [Flavobacteriales bacterium]
MRSLYRSFIGAATWLFAAQCAFAQPADPVDSMLAVPYNDLVRDLRASEIGLRAAIQQAKASGRREAQGDLHRLMGTVIGLTGQSDSAAFHGLAAADIFRQLGHRRKLGVMLCDMGHGTKRRDLDKAFDYYREGIAILEELDARSELTRGYNNFSMLFEMRGDVDSALIIARKGLALKEELNDSTGLPYGLNRVALYLLHKERFEESLALMRRAEEIRRLTNDVHGLAEQQVFFGDLHQAWGRIPEAIHHFREGVRHAQAMGIPYMEQYCQERLAEIHERRGEPDLALIATRRAFAIKDSLLNERNSRVILELEQRYEVAEKDRAIAELGAAAMRRQLMVWLALATLVVVVVSGLLFYQVKRRRQRAERDAAIIRERESGLKAVFEATENERRRLAAELHDGVGQQLGGLKHRLESMREKMPPGDSTAPLADVIHIVDDTSREVRDLAHQMMPKALGRLGLVPALEEMLRRAFQDTGTNFSFDHFGVDGELRSEVATGLYRIAQELVGNIIKHAQANQVDVQLLRNKDHLVLMVQDDGRGFTGSNGQGIGMRNVSDRARAMGGAFEIEGRPGQGTEATVRVPLQVEQEA